MLEERLERYEVWGAWMLYAVHVFVLPLTVAELSAAGTLKLSGAEYNFLSYCISALLCFAVLGKYLRRSFDSLIEAIKRPRITLLSLGGGGIVYAIATLAVTPFLGLIGMEAAPNDENLLSLIAEDRGMMIALTLFISPLVEETVFRGGIFCSLYHKSRFSAYAVSVGLFALYHVWQYAVFLGDPSLLLIGIAYVPAGLALALIYDISGTVWYSMLMHFILNLSGLMALGII